MSADYKTKKKAKIGKIIGFSILGLVLCTVVYGVFWFNGINNMPDEISNSQIPSSPELISFYNKNILNRSSTDVQLNSDQSKYTFNRLFKETNFFHIPSGSQIEMSSLIMYPDGDNMHIATGISVNEAKSSLIPSPLDILFGNQTVYAADSFSLLSNKKYGITATVSYKELPEGIGMKPISVSVGSSPIPVGVAMSIAKQYMPSMVVTDDGYVIIKPMQIIDSTTNKSIGTFTRIDVKNGQAFITIK